MPTIDDPADRVARGVDLLNSRWPGWEKKIDLDRLHIASKCDCILGQLYGSYSLGRSRLPYRNETALELGFDAYDDDEGDGTEDLAAVEAEWRSVIIQRRNRH